MLCNPSKFIHCCCSDVFCKCTLFRGKGGPLVLEKLAWHLPRQGRGFVRLSVCPTPTAVSSFYVEHQRGQLTDWWHQMSSYDQYTLFLCCCCCQLKMSPNIQIIYNRQVTWSAYLRVNCLGFLSQDGQKILPLCPLGRAK